MWSWERFYSIKHFNNKHKLSITFHFMIQTHIDKKCRIWCETFKCFNLIQNVLYLDNVTQLYIELIIIAQNQRHVGGRSHTCKIFRKLERSCSSMKCVKLPNVLLKQLSTHSSTDSSRLRLARTLSKWTDLDSSWRLHYKFAWVGRIRASWVKWSK